MSAYISDFNALFGANYISNGAHTAAGTGDNTKVTGATIDTDGFGSGSILIGYKATLAATKNLTLAIEVQESADGTTWDDAVALQATVIVATGEAGGSTETGVFKLADKLEGRKRYVRYNITPDLDASGTDTVSWFGIFAKGGARELPVA